MKIGLLAHRLTRIQESLETWPPRKTTRQNIKISFSVSNAGLIALMIFLHKLLQLLNKHGNDITHFFAQNFHTVMMMEKSPS